MTLTVFDVESVEGEVDIETEHAEEDSLTDYRWGHTGRADGSGGY